MRLPKPLKRLLMRTFGDIRYWYASRAITMWWLIVRGKSNDMDTFCYFLGHWWEREHNPDIPF